MFLPISSSPPSGIKRSLFSEEVFLGLLFGVVFLAVALLVVVLVEELRDEVDLLGEAFSVLVVVFVGIFYFIFALCPGWDSNPHSRLKRTSL